MKMCILLTNLQFGQGQLVSGLPRVTCNGSKVGICNHLSPHSLTHFRLVDASFWLGSHLEHLHVAQVSSQHGVSVMKVSAERERKQRRKGGNELERENEDTRWNDI